MNSKLLREIYFGAVVILFILLIIFKWDEIKDIFLVFRAYDSLYILYALFMQFFTYVVTALTFRSILHTMGVVVPFGFLFRSSLTILSLNQIIPSLGFSGGAYFVSKTKKYGVSNGKATLCMVLEAIIFYSSFIVLLFLGVFYLFLEHRLAYVQVLLSLAFLVVIFALVFYFFYVLKNKQRISNFLYKIYHRFCVIFRRKENKKALDFLVSEFFLGKEMLLSNKHRFFAPVVYSILKSVFDILTVYFIFLSFGQNPNLGVLTVGFCLATILSYVSFIPGGIGVFELSMAGIYAGFGIPFSLGFVSTIIFRALSFWLPIPVGLLFYRTAK